VTPSYHDPAPPNLCYSTTTLAAITLWVES
jgi:hypothetical protein